MSMGFRIAVLSDLHLEVRHRHYLRDGLSEDEAQGALRRLVAEAISPARTADLVVLAGDVANGHAGVDWAARAFAGQPVVYVAGNHEFYEERIPGLLPRLMAAAGRSGNVAFLENAEARLQVRGRALRLLGCTLWTDFWLHGESGAALAVPLAADRILDHSRIAKDDGSRFLPADSRRLHAASRAWLEEALAEPFDGPTAVVTHHAPSPRSIAPEFVGDPLSPSFASDLTSLIERAHPALWIHGHTHHPVDYRIGKTRVFSNQWGYPKERLPIQAAIVEI
jgi:3',5'-cyclic AMP phosphodiesterase CpdA